MVAETEKAERAIIDANGTLLTNDLGGYGILVTRPVTDEFVVHVNEVARISVDQMSFSAKMRAILPLSSVRSDQNWHVLGEQDWKKGRVKSSWYTLLRRLWLSKKFAEFYDDYTLDITGANGLRVMREQGIHNTIISGIPDASKLLFFNMNKSILPYLDPTHGIILRPNDECSAGNTKVGAGILFAAGATGRKEKVFAFEDDYYLAQLLAGLCNMEVYMPISEGLARSQDHKFDKVYPSGWSSENGHISFNTSIAEVAALRRSSS